MEYYIYPFNAASPGELEPLVPSAVFVFNLDRNDIGIDWKMQTFFSILSLYTNSSYQIIHVSII